MGCSGVRALFEKCGGSDSRKVGEQSERCLILFRISTSNIEDFEIESEEDGHVKGSLRTWVALDRL